MTVDNMLEAIGRPAINETCGQCLACFTGKYPTEIYPDTVLPHEKELIQK